MMKSEIRDGMKVDWDAPIEMDDGVVLRADVFRPVADSQYPVILSYGPYAKGLAMQEGYRHAWQRIVKAAPETLEGSTNKYQNWELFDPEKWGPLGYVLVRGESRGAGRSPGYLETWSAREAKDIALSVDWAGTQPWSNGKVGLHGISNYSMNQWQAAPLKPKHLAAMAVWEGSSDYYRELCRHGGILSDFYSSWYPRQVTAVQHGVGDNGFKSAVTGEPVAGPPTMSEDELRNNRADCDGDALRHRLIDDYYKSRLPKFEDIETPLLSSANWGGMGLHPRGNFEGYLRAGSKQKWLEVHGDTHFTLFYARYGQEMQRKFFDYFLKGEQNGWDKQPKVLISVRHPGETFVQRAETEWPLARTQWTKFYLHPDRELDLKPPEDAATLTYETSSEGATFSTDPLDQEIQITGPVAAKLWVSSDTTDADLFLVLRVFDPLGKEVVFIGSNDPRVPVGLGWLRASHRKLDPNETRPYRPWHTHDELWPLKPGEPVELDIEIWPTSIVVPKGYRVALSVRGKDYEYDGTDAGVAHAPYAMKGVGPFTHTNPVDRPAKIFGGKNTLHFSADQAPYVLLPIIPK